LESLFTSGDKERQEWVLISAGCLSLQDAFYLGPELLHGSNGQFLTALSEVAAFN
jgi:hypothetical protein